VERVAKFGSCYSGEAQANGVNRNFSNIINRRVATWDRQIVVSAQQTRNVATRKTTDQSRLAAAVTSKLEAGNFEAAIRLICSDDTPAADTLNALEALETKHPGPGPDRRPPCDPQDNSHFTPVRISSQDLHKALRSFPTGPFGGPDGLTPQHIHDLLTGATDNNLQQAR